MAEIESTCNTGDPEIEGWFTYHAPSQAQIDRLYAIRANARELAYVIRALTPKSADQTAALRKLREVVMTANAAIVLED